MIWKGINQFPIGSNGRRNASVCLAGLVMAVPITTAWAKPQIDSKVDSSVRQQLLAAQKKGWTSVIVRTGGSLTREQRSRLHNLNADIYRHLDLIESFAVRIPSRNLQKLAELPFVHRLSTDAIVRKYDEFSNGHSGADVAFDDYGLTGAGITVAVIDSGIDNHPDLRDPRTGASRIVGSVNFVPGTTSVADLNGHGTHVAGILAGNGTASTGRSFTRSFYGVARQSNLVNVRVLDALGRTDVSSVVAALQWVVKNRDRHNIRVVNMSLGHEVGESYNTDPLCVAVEKAWKSGIVVVVAAGNDGRNTELPLPLNPDNEGFGTKYGSIGSPGNSPYVITVGAMKSTDGQRQHDAIATYSSRGPSRLDFILKPDIVAPGNKVVSLRKPLSFLELTSPLNVVLASSYRSNANLLTPSDYFELSGTSMAAPVVAGAAALLLEADPRLSPDTVKARLMLTADKWLQPNGKGDVTAFGAGYLDIPSALKCRSVATQFALSPVLQRDADGTVFISKQGIWGERAMWGTGQGLESVFGDRVIAPDRSIFGSRAMWGTNEVWGNRAMWGVDQFRINLGIIVLFGE